MIYLKIQKKTKQKNNIRVFKEENGENYDLAKYVPLKKQNNFAHL